MKVIYRIKDDEHKEPYVSITYEEAGQSVSFDRHFNKIESNFLTKEASVLTEISSKKLLLIPQENVKQLYFDAIKSNYSSQYEASTIENPKESFLVGFVNSSNCGYIEKIKSLYHYGIGHGISLANYMITTGQMNPEDFEFYIYDKKINGVSSSLEDLKDDNKILDEVIEEQYESHMKKIEDDDEKEVSNEEIFKEVKALRREVSELKALISKLTSGDIVIGADGQRITNFADQEDLNPNIQK